MQDFLSKTNYKRIYPQFTELYKVELTKLKILVSDLACESEKYHHPPNAERLFHLAFEKENRLRFIKQAFERMQRALPEDYESDEIVASYAEECKKYLLGINYYLNVATTVRKIFYRKQFEREV